MSERRWQGFASNGNCVSETAMRGPAWRLGRNDVLEDLTRSEKFIYQLNPAFFLVFLDDVDVDDAYDNDFFPFVL